MLVRSPEIAFCKASQSRMVPAAEGVTHFEASLAHHELCAPTFPAKHQKTPKSSILILEPETPNMIFLDDYMSTSHSILRHDFIIVPTHEPGNFQGLQQRPGPCNSCGCLSGVLTLASKLQVPETQRCWVLGAGGRGGGDILTLRLPEEILFLCTGRTENNATGKGTTLRVATHFKGGSHPSLLQGI